MVRWTCIKVAASIRDLFCASVLSSWIITRYAEIQMTIHSLFVRTISHGNKTIFRVTFSNATEPYKLKMTQDKAFSTNLFRNGLALSVRIYPIFFSLCIRMYFTAMCECALTELHWYCSAFHSTHTRSGSHRLMRSGEMIKVLFVSNCTTIFPFFYFSKQEEGKMPDTYMKSVWRKWLITSCLNTQWIFSFLLW